ncbi:MAG: adenine deaminase [Chloroflexi bacterium]|nr:adenine deaminase [Chloroflexota bacterium]
MSTSKSKKTQELIKVALGEAEADLAIVNGDIVNVYSSEVLKGQTVLIKGEKIAYVGNDAAIGSSTQVIDAAGKTLIPGFIDGHTHIDCQYSISEFLRYAMKGGTTTIISETSNIAFPLEGYRGMVEFIKSTKNQPIKIFITISPMISMSPTAREHAITIEEFRKLIRRTEVVGLGESYWALVIAGDERVFDLFSETLKAGKKVEGHTSGAKEKKLQAYVATGASSDHEPITADEVRERLRLGLYVLAREGEVRRELEAIAPIKDEKISLNRLAVATDGIGPWQLTTQGYMEHVVQKVINLGFDPGQAIQMATLNVAQHFGMDNFIGGIAPGKDADIVIIPDLRSIKPECVISKGKVVAKNGQLLIEPRSHNYPAWVKNSVHLPKNFAADDLAIRVGGNREQVKARVVDLVTELVTKEAIIEMPVSNGRLHADTSKDILKIAAIDRTYAPGKTFVGVVKGIGLKQGAIATSATWDSSAIIVIGAADADMAQAINRIRELHGGIVISAGGKILAEIALLVGGVISTEPMETISEKFHAIQRAATELGCHLPDIRLTLATFTSPAIAHLRICEHGLFSIRQNQFVDLIVE